MADRWDDLGKKWDDKSYKHASDLTNNTRWTIVKYSVAFIVFLVVLTLVGNALSIVNVFWGADKAKITEPARVTQATYSTGNALVNIAYFHAQCQDILADQQNYQNALQTLAVDQNTLKTVSDPIAQEQAGSAVSQDQSAVLGVKDQLANDVAEYNAKSATQTANPFKAHNLPYRFVLNGHGLLDGSPSCN
jgi:hypothetical protein